MAFIKEIQTPDNNKHQIKNTIIPVIGTQTSSTSSWTGNIDLPSLYDGLTIAYFLPYDSVSGISVSLKLTLSDGSQTSAIACYISSSRLGTQYSKGTNIIMTYWSKGSINIDGTATTNDRWIAHADYNTDVDTNTWRNIQVNGTEKLGTGIDTGALNFIDGTNTAVSYNGGVKIDASDEKVNQTLYNDNAGVPILLASVNYQDTTSTINGNVRRSNNLYLNPTTGAGRFKGNSTSFTLQDTVIDLADSSNGVSSTQTRAYRLRDKNNWIISSFYGNIGTNTISTGIYCYNRDKDNPNGTTYSAGIVIKINKTGVISYEVTEPTAFRTAIGAGTSDLIIGTTSTTAMAGNTTFPTIIATDSGTNQLTLAASTKYKLTAGGTSYIFTTPPNTNTTYTIATGDSNGQIKVTPSSGNAYNVDVKGLGDRAFDSTSYLPLSGGTATGSIYVSGTTEKRISLKNPTSNNLEIYMASVLNGRHGLYSTGYLDAEGGTYVNSGKWLVIRDHTTGNVNFYGNATTATTASKLSNTSKIGDTTKPVYFTANGVPSACSYSLNATVPSDAVFTDTDTKVNQDNSTSTSYRSLLLGPTTTATTYNTTSQNDVTYRNVNLRFKPSEAKLIIGSAEIENVNTSGTQGILILYDGNDHYCSLKQSQITGSITHTLPTTGSELVNLNATQALTNKTYNGYTLADACAKGVTDNSSATAVTSSDTNLITGRTLYYAGYSKTDENVKTVNGVSSTNRYIVFKTNSGTDTSTCYTNTGFSYRSVAGTTSTDGYSQLVLGNSTNSGTADNQYGIIRFYPKTGAGNSSYANLMQTSMTNNSSITHILPATGGTIVNRATNTALTSNQIVIASGDSTISSSDKTIATSITNVDTTVPTSKAVKTYVDTYYLPLTGGTMTGNILFTSYSGDTRSDKSIQAYDSQDKLFSLIRYNGSGLWIGASTSNENHHAGKTYISAGYDYTNNTYFNTAYISRPSISGTTWSQSSYGILHTGNYNSYSPTLTGTGASGDWGINITGNAATATTADKVKQTLSSASSTYPLLWSGSKTTVSTTTVNSSVYRNNDIYVNPGLGIIHANKFLSGVLEIAPVLTSVDSVTISEGVVSTTNLNTKYIYASSGNAISVGASLTFQATNNIQMADKIVLQVYTDTDLNKTVCAVGAQALPLTLHGTAIYLKAAAYTSTGAAVTSDKRLKTNIEIVDNRYLNLIKNLEPKRFKLKNNPSQKYHTGFIAQDVKELLKKYNINEEEFAAFARPKEDDSEYALSYTEFIPLLLLYIKDLEKQIKEIKKEQD